MFQLEYQKEVRRTVQYLIILILVSLGLLIPSKASALTITPAYSETYLNYEQQANKSFVVKNDKNYDIYLRAKIYKYYPPSDTISEPEKHEEFTMVDTDTILLPANGQTEIKYQVYAKPNLEYGTYYNLIALQLQSEFEEEMVGSIPTISFLSALHITDMEVK